MPKHDVKLFERFLAIFSENNMEISENFGISQVKIGNDFSNRTLREIGIKPPRDKYSISIIALRHNEEIIISPSLDTILYAGDTITVCGNDEDVGRFSN